MIHDLGPDSISLISPGGLLPVDNSARHWDLGVDLLPRSISQTSGDSVYLRSPLKNQRRSLSFAMSLRKIIAGLPRLTFEERQILIQRALELDDPPLSAADEGLVEARLAEHHANPSSSGPLDEMKRRLRS